MNSTTRSLTAASKGVLRRLGLVTVLVMVCWLIPASPALANFSTLPGWYWLNPLPVSSGDGANWLSAAMYGNDAWISGAGPTLLHSTDSGRTWQPQETSSTVNLDDLTFVSPTIGWAGSAGASVGAVMRTTDGGQGWTTTDPCGTNSVQCLFALDATHAWAGCSPYASNRAWTSLYRTTDGGASWATLSLPCPFDDVVFTSPTDGWGVADTDTFYDPGGGEMLAIIDVTSTIYRSSDAGASWTPVRTTPHEDLDFVASSDASHIFAGGASVTVHGPMSDATYAPLVVRSADTGADWSPSAPSAGAGDHVTDLTFADDSRGWAAVSTAGYEPGAVYATTDGGASWSVLGSQGFDAIACAASGDLVACDATHLMAAPAGCPYASVDPSSSALGTAEICGLSFADQQQGWAVAASTTVYRTTNAGARWDSSTIPFLNSIAQPLYDVYYQGPTRLWAVGGTGAMVRSTDNGVTWSAVDSSTSQTLRGITFDSAGVGWAVGGPSLLKSADGGTSWNPLYLNGSHSWSGVACPSAGVICLVGSDDDAGRGCVVRSTDGGSSWQQVLTAAGNGLEGESFQDAVHGWAWGPHANLYATTDGGATWTPRDLSNLFPPTRLSMATIYGVAFTSASTGIASFYLPPQPKVLGMPWGYYILTTTDGGTTWAESSPGGDTTPVLWAVASSGDRVWLAGAGANILANFDADPTPPVTTDAYNGLWTNQDVNLGFSATDAGIGVAYTRFASDVLPWTYGSSLTVPAPSDHSNDGAHKVEFQSVDKLGNAETPQTQLVNIDTVPPGAPGVLADPDPVATNGYVGPNPTFRFRGLDSALAASLGATTSMNAVAVSGSDAYFADGTTLKVLDVSDPSSPQQVGSLTGETGLSDVVVSGSLACLALGSNGLATVDISDPTHPVLEGSCAITGGAYHVVLSGHYAYVATGSSTLVPVNLTTPAAPVAGTGITLPSPPVALAATSRRLCVVSGNVLRVFTTAAAPTPLGTCNLGVAGKGVAVYGGLACVADGTNGIYLVDVGGTTPTVLSHTAYSGTLGTATLSGSLAMVGKAATVVGGNGSVVVLDVTSTSRPVVMGTFSTIDTPLALTADGQYLYLAAGKKVPFTIGGGIWKVMPTESASYLVDTTSGTVPDTVADGGAGSATFSGLAGGPAYFHVRTCDEAGNWGTSADLAFTVDATPPTTADNTGSVWHAAPFTLTLTPTDGASGMSGGLAKTEYSTDGGVTWVTGTSLTFAAHWKRGGGSGAYPVKVRSTDAVGNVESSRTVYVDVDTSAPTSGATLGTVQSGQATVYLKGSDAYSGVASIWYSLDGASWTQVAYPGGSGAPVTVSGAGSHTLSYYAVDAAGNVQVGYNVCLVTITGGTQATLSDLPSGPATTPAHAIRHDHVRLRQRVHRMRR